MDNKIEPGCKAIFIGLVLDRDLNGCEVAVLNYDALGSEVFEEDHWRVHCEKIGRSGPVREKNLMRIDGGGFKQNTAEKEKELCHG